jgi:hypothetical protein
MLVGIWTIVSIFFKVGCSISQDLLVNKQQIWIRCATPNVEKQNNKYHFIYNKIEKQTNNFKIFILLWFQLLPG